MAALGRNRRDLHNPVVNKKNINCLTPILIIPEFELYNQPFPSIVKAIITITKGYTRKDKLDIDSNFTVVKQQDQFLLQNTNISLPEGGYNPKTHQLIFQGEDSVATYAELFESILLETSQQLDNHRYTINFRVVDNENISHHLGNAKIKLTESSNNQSFIEQIYADEAMAFLIDDYLQSYSYYDTNYKISFSSQDEYANNFSIGQHVDIFETEFDIWPRMIELSEVKHGPSEELYGEESWTLSIDGDTPFVIKGNSLFFEKSATGLIKFANGADLYFEDVDAISWSE